MIFRNLYIKLQVWRGKAIDIWSKSPYPANVLSNLYPNAFLMDGVTCASMEGFLQSLKYASIDTQKAICQLSGKEAKNMTNNLWQETQQVYWQGTTINRQSDAFQQLIQRAYQALYEQNEVFRNALLATRDKKLYHSNGEPNPYKTILTEQELCSVLMNLRDK